MLNHPTPLHGATFVSLIVTVSVIVGCILYCFLLFSLLALIFILRRACCKSSDNNISTQDGTSQAGSINGTNDEEKLTLEAAKKKYLDGNSGNKFSSPRKKMKDRDNSDMFHYVSPKRSTLFYISSQRREAEDFEKGIGSAPEDKHSAFNDDGIIPDHMRDKRDRRRKGDKDDEIFSYGTI